MKNHYRYLLDENVMIKDTQYSPNMVSVKDVLPLGTTDRNVLKYARDMGFIVITKDIRMALSAIVMDQPIIFIDMNDNRHFLEKKHDSNI